jgi:carbonic anhydrase
MSALLGEKPPGKSMPHLREWLKLAAPVREIIQSQYAHLSDESVRINTAGEENVLFGLENLHSYHCVQERLMDGSLRLHGWFFKIATAELFAYDPETRQFSPLASEK